MRARVVVAAALVAAVACGRSEPRPTPFPRIESQDLQNAVLHQEDMGDGWVRKPSPPFNTVQIGGRVGAANVDPAVAEATSAFQQSGGSGFVSNSIFLLRAERMARAVIAAHSDAAQKTRWTQDRTDGGTATFRFQGSIADLPVLGDDMFAARLKVTVAEASGRTTDHAIDYVCYRIGPIVAFVVAQDVGVGRYARRQENTVARLITP